MQRAAKRTTATSAPVFRNSFGEFVPTTAKASETDPIRVAEVDAGAGIKKIGKSLAPEKRGVSRRLLKMGR